MIDYLNIGPTPVEEPCAQVGSENYNKLSSIECIVFRNQLQHLLDNHFKAIHVHLRTKTFPHDFGSYKEVVVEYNDEDEKAVKQAFWLESNTPENWDEEAKQILESMGYKL